MTDRYRAGRGEPLVLLHGLGATWRVWRPLLEALTPHYDVIALTLPGHSGAAPFPESGAPAARVLVEWLNATLDRESIGAAHFVGSSLGGALALEMARDSRALSVLAIAPIGMMRPAEADRMIRRLSSSRAASLRLAPVARWLAGFATGRRLLFREVLHRPETLSAEVAREWLVAYRDCSCFDTILKALGEQTPTPLSPRGGCAVCIVWPAEDRMTPETPFADRFTAAMPYAARERIPAAGHIPMSDAPEELAALIRRHARSPGKAAEGRA